MAITAATLKSDFTGFINTEMAAPIFEDAARISAVQQLARQVPLSDNGKSIPFVDARPTAAWVNEGGQKAVTAGGMALKTITPEKIAAIMVVSQEVVRLNPGGFVDTIRPQLAEAFAIAFDYATLHDLGGSGTGTGPFATYIDQTTKSVELGSNATAAGGIYQDLVDAITELVTDTDATSRPYRATGFALDNVFEPRLLRAVDTTGRPLWTDLATDSVGEGLSRPGMILGRRSFMGDGVANASQSIVGYAGDWTKAAWGVVGGIEYAVSTEAAVTINGSLTSLFENNLVAIRAEAQYGFVVADADAFVQLRNDSGS